jgi:hypothetical protein
MASGGSGPDENGADSTSPFPGPPAPHSMPQASPAVASGVVALAIDQLSPRVPHNLETVQERARKLADDITAYLPQVLSNAAAHTTLHGLLHTIGFGELQHSSDKIECLTSMMDPITLWDPHGCLAHRPVFQFIRRALEIYGIPYASPPSRADIRFSPLLRKDVRVRVAYSLYEDERELNAALDGIFAIQAAFEQRNGSPRTSTGSTEIYHSPPERRRELPRGMPYVPNEERDVIHTRREPIQAPAADAIIAEARSAGVERTAVEVLPGNFGDDGNDIDHDDGNLQSSPSGSKHRRVLDGPPLVFQAVLMKFTVLENWFWFSERKKNDVWGRIVYTTPQTDSLRL